MRLSVSRDEDTCYLTGRDITRRKRAEQRLLDQMHFTEDIISHLPGIFFLTDEKGKIKKWNNNLTEAEDRRIEEVKNKSYRSFISEKDHQRIERAFGEVLKKGFASIEVGFITKNNVTTPLLLSGFRYRMQDETYVIGIGIDISEEKQAREELQRKEQKLEQTLENLEEAQRIARMGSWKWHIREDKLEWSNPILIYFSVWFRKTSEKM